MARRLSSKLTLPGLEVPLGLEPMEAEARDELPTGPQWMYEPKYDGFRCVAFRAEDAVRLQSRTGRPLDRYFPEVVDCLLSLPTRRFVIDSELVILGQPFDVLQLRLHPAASRVARLALEHPATLLAFDLLAASDGRSLLGEPFAARRQALEELFGTNRTGAQIQVSRTTRSAATARRWIGKSGLDGVVAKRLDRQYRPGKRAMVKFKVWRSVDCVVGGLYLRPSGRAVDFLLLGLYDDEGKLNYVGRAGAGEHAEEMAEVLEPLFGGEGFTGRAPAGVSRWSAKARRIVPLRPVVVAEVSADHIEGGRFRHGSRLIRFRDDKDPSDCTMDQVKRSQPEDIR